MIALLLAAQLSAATAAVPDIPLVQRRRGVVAPPTLCDTSHALQTGYAAPALLMRPQDKVVASARRLTDLPKANREDAVMRTIAGCPVPVAIAYGVEGDGHFAADGR